MGTRAKELSGKIFGKLTVIKRVGTKQGYALWLCQCVCGNKTEVTTGNLRKTRSCGCSTVNDLLGKIFGRLTVLKRVGSKRGFARWLCQCVCGKQTTVYGTCLVRGVTKSCGCLRLERLREVLKVNRIGQRFGRLVVISAVPQKDKKRTQWLCQCDCGTKKEIISGQLVAGQTRSCGCLGKETTVRKNFKHGQAKRGHKTTEYGMWCNAKKRAIRRGIPFAINLTDIRIPNKCPILGVTLQVGTGVFHNDSPSLDCKIPELGYVPSNIWVISWRANKIKSDATVEELEAIVKALKG